MQFNHAAAVRCFPGRLFDASRKVFASRCRIKAASRSSSAGQKIFIFSLSS